MEILHEDRLNRHVNISEWVDFLLIILILIKTA